MTIWVWFVGCVHPVAAPPPVAAAPAPAPVEAALPEGWVEDPTLPPHRLYHTAKDALLVALASRPRVLGVGELHETGDVPVARSAMRVFTEELLPVLAPSATDLVLETWRLDGRCGPEEQSVATGVDEQTDRPPEVKDELTLLVEAAVAAQVRPHDLRFTCDEYAGLLDHGELVTGRLLRLLTVKLGDYAQQALATPGATLVLYGGAVHNDLFPTADLADYSYGAALADAPYVELDLYPPELVRGALVEPAWAPLLAATGPDHVVLYRRSPKSFVLLLPTGP